MILTRFAYLDTCTLGWLEHAGSKFATIERPWLPSATGPGGTSRISCIPDGEYHVEPFSGLRFVDVFRLSNPALGIYPDAIPAGQGWGRTSILIHPGNSVEDVVGCIAIGRQHVVLGNAHRVVDSRNALADLRDALAASPADTLTIRPFGGTNA